MFKKLLKVATHVVLLCYLSLCSDAQVQVSGAVFDEKAPLPWTIITDGNNTKQVTADSLGNFKIDVPKNSTLVFSFVLIYRQYLILLP